MQEIASHARRNSRLRLTVRQTLRADGSELALCGIALIDPSKAPELVARVRPEHFHHDIYRAIWWAIDRVVTEGGSPDGPSLLRLLPQTPAFRGSSSEEIEAELVAILKQDPSVPCWPYHVRQVLQAARARGAWCALHDAQHELGQAGPEQADEVIGQLLARLQQLPGAASPKPQPFPDVLPPPFRGFARSVADAIGVPTAFVGAHLLAVAAGCIGNARAVQAKQGWVEPAVIWAVVVARSGTAKTPALEAVLQLLDPALDQWQAEYTEAKEAWESLSKEDRGDPPRMRRLLVKDTTVEALARVLVDNPRGLLVARDELAGFFGAVNQYKPRGRGSDEANWLEMWSAGRLVVDRKTAESLHIRRAAVSICGTIQPGVLERALGGRHLEDGMAARFLFAWPPAPPKQWTDVEVPAELIEACQARIAKLLALAPLDGPAGPEPVLLPLTPEAREMFIAWHAEHAARVDAAPGPLASALAKLEAYCLRLALVVALMRDPQAQAVGNGAMATGIVLANYFVQEAERIYRELLGVAERPQLPQGDPVMLWLTETRETTPRQLQRRFRSRFRRVEDAERYLRTLAEQGKGRFVPRPPGPQGGRPTQVFVLAQQAKSQMW